MKQKKQRLDELVLQKYPDLSRRQIQSWIMQGLVRVDDQVVTKAGAAISADATIVCQGQQPKFVSRAGFKLEKALDHFGIDVTGLVALDAGISTGGFTDCLLQHGAKKIYGVDVGYGQVHEKIRQDARLHLMERTNLRLLESVGELVDLVTLDLSFISVLKVLDAVKRVLKADGALLILIKPQFEAERRDIGKGGIVTDAQVHERVITQVTEGVVSAGFTYIGITDSPLRGADGNKEFLAFFKRAA